ncbi:MAG: hypothetical protein K9G67_10880 [Bacteroidales bacterium]|nr:hypothetical protein [Bacteroidales bacterium]MCF8352589.1 hypothetical protein [Bacteroidales bacterium]MCF8376849.1 hypothetical protein [Bacteroidales bacterium]MCF8400756.1 hypothetical protein [Bacteroidales bacterium]
MKRILVLFSLAGLLLMINPAMQAQERPNQFSAGYGVITIDEELTIIESVIPILNKFAR